MQRKQKPINYQMINYVKDLLNPDMAITDAVVEGKWLNCTLNGKQTKMASYNGQPRLAASITFKVHN